MFQNIFEYEFLCTYGPPHTKTLLLHCVTLYHNKRPVGPRDAYMIIHVM